MPAMVKWEEAELGTLVRIDRLGITPEHIETGTKYVGMEDLHSDGSIVNRTVVAGELRSAKFAFSDRHVLYGKLRPYLCKVARPDFSGVCSTDILPISAGPRIDRDYLYHVFRQPRFVSMAVGRSEGVNLPRLSPSKLLEFSVSFPPIATQRRIATILDTADSIRQKRGERSWLLDHFLRSIFLEMFGHPASNEKGWVTSALGEIADVNRGQFTPRPRNDPQYYGGNHPFIQTGDIVGATGLLKNWRQTLNQSGATVSRQFPKGTIAIAIAANIGDTAIVDFDFYCPDSVVGIVAKSGVEPSFLEMCLRFLKPMLVSLAPMTAQRNINLGILRPMRIPLPPLELQRRFAGIREASLAVSDRIQAAENVAESLFNSTAQAVFGASNGGNLSQSTSKGE